MIQILHSRFYFIKLYEKSLNFRKVDLFNKKFGFRFLKFINRFEFSTVHHLWFNYLIITVESIYKTVLVKFGVLLTWHEHTQTFRFSYVYTRTVFERVNQTNQSKPKTKKQFLFSKTIIFIFTFNYIFKYLSSVFFNNQYLFKRHFK